MTASKYNRVFYFIYIYKKKLVHFYFSFIFIFHILFEEKGKITKISLITNFHPNRPIFPSNTRLSLKLITELTCMLADLTAHSRNKLFSCQ